MRKHILLAALVAAAVALTAPATASAATGTPAPDLPAGVHPACIANADGECEHATIMLSGRLDTQSSSGVNISCTNDMTITFYADGTSDVTAFNPGTPCTTNIPGCQVHTAATNLDWGDRLGYDTSDGTYRDYINADIDATFTPGCPIVGTFTQSGLLKPEVTIVGGVMHVAFNGASSGILTSPLGTQTVTGSLTSTSGVGSDTQLIPIV